MWTGPTSSQGRTPSLSQGRPGQKRRSPSTTSGEFFCRRYVNDNVTKLSYTQTFVVTISTLHHVLHSCTFCCFTCDQMQGRTQRGVYRPVQVRMLLALLSSRNCKSHSICYPVFNSVVTVPGDALLCASPAAAAQTNYGIAGDDIGPQTLTPKRRSNRHGGTFTLYSPPKQPIFPGA